MSETSSKSDLAASTCLQESIISNRVGYEAALEIAERNLEALTDSPAKPSDPHETTAPVLSIVMPCLNEADTLATCIQKAQQGLAAAGISGEIIVSDNGSTDGSQEIAQQMGARVVHASERGYGAALMAGIEAARGEFCIMGDADDSYDFREIPSFYKKLTAGADLVQGCRLPRGGGEVLPGAMPWSHRWIGNPMLTFLAANMFRAPVDDIYCGLRGFRRTWQQGLSQKCTGMEFAVEMIVKASLFGTAIAQVPIKLHPDGRIAHKPHLRTFRDGWRTLRFFLLHSPRHTLLTPGAFLCALGSALFAVAMPGLTIGPATFGAHSLLVAMLLMLVGTQIASCAVIAKVFATGAGLMPSNLRLEKSLKFWNLEKRLLVCGSLMAIGLGLIGATANAWLANGFGELAYESTLRRVIPGVALIGLATQLGATSFVIGLLRMGRRQPC